MKAHKDLINYALNHGDKVFLNVFDGEAWVGCKRDAAKALAAIESVEESTLSVRETLPEPVMVDGELRKSRRLASFFILPGLAPDETVADYSDNEFADAWFSQYDA